MNLTVSVDDRLLQRARRVAEQRGVSLQELLRGYLESLVGERSGAEAADELLELMEAAGGHSGARHIDREEAYEDRL